MCVYVSIIERLYEIGGDYFASFVNCCFGSFVLKQDQFSSNGRERDFFELIRKLGSHSHATTVFDWSEKGSWQILFPRRSLQWMVSKSPNRITSNGVVSNRITSNEQIVTFYNMDNDQRE